MTWGLCRECKWWQLEPGAKASPTTVGLCIDDKLFKYRIRISGVGGCTRFMEGKPAHAKGSSDQPPTAQPAR